MQIDDEFEIVVPGPLDGSVEVFFGAGDVGVGVYEGPVADGESDVVCGEEEEWGLVRGLTWWFDGKRLGGQRGSFGTIRAKSRSETFAGPSKLDLKGTPSTQLSPPAPALSLPLTQSSSRNLPKIILRNPTLPMTSQPPLRLPSILILTKRIFIDDTPI